MILRLFTDIGTVCIWGTAVLLVAALAMYTAMERWGWARNWVGRIIVGLATAIVVIYIPSLIALADPAFTGFGAKIWYRWVAIGTVIFTFAISAAMVATLEYVRRLKKKVRNGQGRR